MEPERRKQRRYHTLAGEIVRIENLIQAIEAHALLPEAVRRRTPLVIAGAKGWVTGALEERIAAAERSGDLRWLGYVPAPELPLLYAAARLLVYPSIYEGFGFPPLEAMASGVPVVTSNQASLPEVAGDAAVMVDPRDREALREAMQRFVEDDGEVRRRVELGHAQAAKFTWRGCAEQTLGVYREAIQASGSR